MALRDCSFGVWVQSLYTCHYGMQQPLRYIHLSTRESMAIVEKLSSDFSQLQKAGLSTACTGFIVISRRVFSWNYTRRGNSNNCAGGPIYSISGRELSSTIVRYISVCVRHYITSCLNKIEKMASGAPFPFRGHGWSTKVASQLATRSTTLALRFPQWNTATSRAHRTR